MRSPVLAVPLPFPIPDGVARRFKTKVAIGEPDDCWEWTGRRSEKGYGTLYFDGHFVSAHRVSYLLSCGPLSSSDVVCHKCDNPPCVNPSHLWLGSVLENNRDRHSKGRSRGGRLLGSTHHNSKLNEDIVREILASKLSNVALGEKYGVTFQVISTIRNGRAWRHVQK